MQISFFLLPASEHTAFKAEFFKTFKFTTFEVIITIPNKN